MFGIDICVGDDDARRSGCASVLYDIHACELGIRYIFARSFSVSLVSFLAAQGVFLERLRFKDTRREFTLRRNRGSGFWDFSGYYDH